MIYTTIYLHAKFEDRMNKQNLEKETKEIRISVGAGCGSRISGQLLTQHDYIFFSLFFSLSLYNLAPPYSAPSFS